MGCLLEIILLPFELILELIVDGWFSLMQWIIPKKNIGKSTRLALKIVVGIFSGALLIVFLIGILAAALTDATVMDLWKWIFIPIGISLAQIILGIIVRIVTRKK